MYSVSILRRAIKDIANLPEDYARLVSRHIDRFKENPRSPGAKKLRGRTDYSFRESVTLKPAEDSFRARLERNAVG